MDEVTLRHRADGALELRVNGVFVMDDVETSSERLLARHATDAGAREILVGGLGLGYTARELLAEPSVVRVVVAELHGEIVDRMRDGTIPGADLLADPRLEVVVADVREVVAAQPDSSLDAILLDVDNGPDFLVHEQNAAVYGLDFVDRCAESLRPGGRLGVWSMADSASLRTILLKRFTALTAETVDVTLQGRAERYWILGGSSPRRSDIVRP